MVDVTPPSTPGYRHGGTWYARAIDDSLRISYHLSSDDPDVHEECKWEMAGGALIINKDVKLGSGAFADVYEGESVTSGTPVAGELVGAAPVTAILQARFANQTYADCKTAVKMLRECHDAATRTEFLAEIRVMKELLHHPHLVRLLGASPRWCPDCQGV